MWGTSCLFSVCPTVRGPYLDLDQLKTEVTMGGSVCFLWGVLYKHFRTPLKSRSKDVRSISLMSGMLFINNKSAEAGAPQLGGAGGPKLGDRLFPSTVSPRHSDTQRHIACCGWLITVCKPMLVLHTYLLLGCEEWKEAFILDLTSLDHTPQEMWVNIYP